jgi:MOSC domain-containing protein YiiM
MAFTFSRSWMRCCRIGSYDDSSNAGGEHKRRVLGYSSVEAKKKQEDVMGECGKDSGLVGRNISTSGVIKR